MILIFGNYAYINFSNSISVGQQWVCLSVCTLPQCIRRVNHNVGLIWVHHSSPHSHQTNPYIYSRERGTVAYLEMCKRGGGQVVPSFSFYR